MPANPVKALQVVVSRPGPRPLAEVVHRTDHGYRLGLPARTVDALPASRRRWSGPREAEGRRDLTRGPATSRARPSPCRRRAAQSTGPLGDAPRRCRPPARDRGRRPRPGAVRAGDHDEALRAARPRRRATTRARWPPCCAARRRCRARRPPSTVRAPPDRRRRPARRRPGSGAAGACTPSCSRPTARCAPACASRPRRWSAGTTTSARCEAVCAASRVTSILGPAGWARPGSRTCWAGRPSSRSCTSSSWSGSRPRRTWSARSAPRSGSATRSAAAACLTRRAARDVRARIAPALDQAPTLLILDNCEHVSTRSPTWSRSSSPPARDLRVRHHDPRTARRSRPNGSSRSASSAEDAAADCSASGPRPPGRA